MNGTQLTLPLVSEPVSRWMSRFPRFDQGARIAQLVVDVTRRKFISPVRRMDQHALNIRVQEAFSWEAMVRATVLAHPNELDLHVTCLAELDGRYASLLRAQLSLAEHQRIREWVCDEMAPFWKGWSFTHYRLGIRQTVFYAVAFLAIGREDLAEELLPMLGLWRDGIFPCGTLIDQTRGVVIHASS